MRAKPKKILFTIQSAARALDAKEEEVRVIARGLGVKDTLDGDLVLTKEELGQVTLEMERLRMEAGESTEGLLDRMKEAEADADPFARLLMLGARFMMRALLSPRPTAKAEPEEAAEPAEEPKEDDVPEVESKDALPECNAFEIAPGESVSPLISLQVAAATEEPFDFAIRVNRFDRGFCTDCGRKKICTFRAAFLVAGISGLKAMFKRVPFEGGCPVWPREVDPATERRDAKLKEKEKPVKKEQEKPLHMPPGDDVVLALNQHAELMAIVARETAQEIGDLASEVAILAGVFAAVAEQPDEMTLAKSKALDQVFARMQKLL